MTNLKFLAIFLYLEKSGNFYGILLRFREYLKKILSNNFAFAIVCFYKQTINKPHSELCV